MLWIIGGAAVVRALADWLKTPALQTAAQQLEHVKWQGLQAYDLIFPLFMFLSGIALPLSLGGRLERGDPAWKIAWKILSRTALLVLLGMIYNGLLSGNPAQPRLASVLGQIGIAWGIAATLYMMVQRVRTRLSILLGLLLLVTVLQLWVPVPGHGAGELTPDGAINCWLDRQCLPGRLYGKTFDPEGLLCILSASAVTIAGTLVGDPLRVGGACSWQRAGLQLLVGAGIAGLGWLCWHFGYPPVKALWTATFDLLAIGISLLLFTIFFTVIDVARIRYWCFPLQVIGMNALTIYLATRFFPLDHAVDLCCGRLARACGDGGPAVLAGAVLLIEWLALLFLYRKKCFLRV